VLIWGFKTSVLWQQTQWLQDWRWGQVDILFRRIVTPEHLRDSSISSILMGTSVFHWVL
jgi:hypothetical protein